MAPELATLLRPMTKLEWIGGGLLAAAVVAVAAPRVGDAGERERIETLGHRLAVVRNAIQRYYHEHELRYPGNPAPGEPGEATAARFVAHLTEPVDNAGAPAASGARLGPYLDAGNLPESPVAEGLTDRRSVAVQATSGYLEPDGRTAWLYNPENGRFIANHSEYASY